MENKSLKKFVGEQAYNTIKNISVNSEAIHKALVTPQNARNVFSELSEFEIKSLCAEISNDGTIGTTRKTTQEEIKNVFNSAGYDTVIFDNEQLISDCKKYYANGEVICTYNNLKSRMNEYHMIIAIKKDIDKIQRAKIPQRDDVYGTSILNIQIAKNASHMSIKNRYNHTVSEPDSTLNNNLDTLYFGLQSMVLGYYNLASLTNKRQYYKNIVNIGGVYLKYHTEKSNIYFGSFVLDGVNGVRYADSSRYYVTEDKNIDNYYNHPLVLDFKNKCVIDILRNGNEHNGKALLLTKSMKQGILTSANKEEADTISASFENVKQELLKCNNKALQYIHVNYGYDFTKPFKVTGILGKFTAKSIEKLTGSDTGVLLIYARNEFKVCHLLNGTFYSTDLKHTYFYKIDKFYNKGGFEEVRKSGKAATFIIQQEKQFIKKPEQTRENYRYTPYPEIIDKSGYSVSEARYILDNRLREYKQSKRAREAAQTDYTTDILEITELFNDLKNIAMLSFQSAKTYEEYEKFTNAIDYQFAWLIRDIESFKNHVSKNDFSSVDDAQMSITKIKLSIEKIRIKLSC